MLLHDFSLGTHLSVPRPGCVGPLHPGRVVPANVWVCATPLHHGNSLRFVTPRWHWSSCPGPNTTAAPTLGRTESRLVSPPSPPSLGRLEVWGRLVSLETCVLYDPEGTGADRSVSVPTVLLRWRWDAQGPPVPVNSCGYPCDVSPLAYVRRLVPVPGRRTGAQMDISTPRLGSSRLGRGP